MQVQWYPGHMTKARRQMQEDMKLVDLVIELLDARVPGSSRNPDIDEMAKNKYRMILLNKADLADERATREWVAHFKERGAFVLRVDARSGSCKKPVAETVSEVCREKAERDRRRGIKNRPVRAMVVGIPNVGKSTFINTYAGKACAKTGNKPGVTKGKQWIRLGKNLDLLDTPGILWPKFEDEAVGTNLALIGSIRDEVIEPVELSLSLISFLGERYPGALQGRYGGEGSAPLASDGASPADVLGEIARARGCIGRGAEPDYGKAAALLIDDFRSGRLGRISLERPGG